MHSLNSGGILSLLDEPNDQLISFSLKKLVSPYEGGLVSFFQLFLLIKSQSLNLAYVIPNQTIFLRTLAIHWLVPVALVG